MKEILRLICDGGLSSKREIANKLGIQESTLVLLVPCSGRVIVILGLVGFYIGMNAAFATLVLDLIVIMAVGFVLSRLMPEVTPGLILEIPDIRRPVPKIVLQKTWLRLKEFLIIAWPILIISSLFLSLIEFYGVGNIFNNLLTPLTSNLLGLPLLVGVPLVLIYFERSWR